MESDSASTEVVVPPQVSLPARSVEAESRATRRVVARAGTLVAACLLLAASAACLPATPAAATVVYAVPALPVTTKPLDAVDIVSRWAVEMVYDGLIDINDRLEIVPALASTWDIAPNGLIYTFTLRSGLRWQDGTPVTAGQVADTYRAILDPAVKVVVPRSDYQTIAAVDAPDDATLRFRLRQPDASLLSKLNLGIARFDGGLSTSVGTGPFVEIERVSGERLVFAANPHFWAGAPGLARIVWQAVPDSAAQIVLLRNGGADGAQVSDPREADRLKAAGLTAHPTWSGNIQVSLRLTDPLFADRRVRQALAAATDRQAMIGGLLAGQGRVSSGDILPESWAFSPDAASVQGYDPDRARALLNEAGWRPGSDNIMARGDSRLAFTMITDSGDQLRRQIALLLRQQWQKAGIDVDVQFLERNAMVTERVLRGQFQAALLQTSVRADPDLSRRFHSRSIAAGQNFVGYNNPALDALLDDALAANSRQHRAALYSEAQLLLARDAPQINLLYPSAFYVFDAGLTGVRPSAMSPFWNVQEWRR